MRVNITESSIELDYRLEKVNVFLNEEDELTLSIVPIGKKVSKLEK
jgi:hypothetical protein